MENISVIGSGVMGREISYVAAANGFNVCLMDIRQEALQSAEAHIEQLVRKSHERGFLKTDVSACLRRIRYTLSMEEAGQHADLVIEAVIEKMDLKVEIFKTLDRICREQTILATNTSTMSPTEIGAQTSRADRCIAMHFFNPVHRMKLVEIVRGLDTSDETVRRTRGAGKMLGKEIVEVNEFPGFVTSRMNCLIGNEAMNMLMQGVASAEDIDKAMKLGLNHPMGPLELADLVGLDTRLRNMEYLHQHLGEKYLPCPLLVKYVKAGRLGKKSGMGFYRYDEAKGGTQIG